MNARTHNAAMIGLAAAVALAWMMPGSAARAAPPDKPEAAPPAAPPAVAPEPLKDLGRKYKVSLVYFVPKDRQPTTNYREKIAVLMTFVNDMYARDLRSKGYERAGLDFEFQDGKPAVHLINGKEPAAHYNGDPNFDGQRQWRLIVPEVEAALGKASQHLYVMFVETYDDGPVVFEWRGGFALGARFSTLGGVGMFSAWILRDEFCAATVEEELRLLGDDTPIEGRVANHGRRPNSPRFEFIEDGFGAVAHETGHAFGLVHDLRADNVDIMANGFRWLRNNYLPGKGPKAAFLMDEARLLRWSRYLSDDVDDTDNEPPRAKIEHPAKLRAGATTIPLGGELTDNKALAAVMFWSPQRDWVLGGGDLAGPRVRLNQVLIVPPLAKGTFELVVFVIDKGGNLSTVRVKVEVE